VIVPHGVHVLQMNIRTIILGALAGVIGFLLGHQPMIELFHALDIVSFRGYRMGAVAPLNVPAVLSGAFWCALWGIVLAVLWHRLPGGRAAIKGLIFGLVFVQALGNWILVPLFKGTAYFHGWNASWMLITACFQAAFGVVMGVAYHFLARK
jgi:hypothetical protein